MGRANTGDCIGKVLIKVLHTGQPAADHMNPCPIAEEHGQFMAVVGHSSQEGFKVIGWYEDRFFFHRFAPLKAQEA
jgi:hypothetical protein